MLNLLVYKIT